MFTTVSSSPSDTVEGAPQRPLSIHSFLRLGAGCVVDALLEYPADGLALVAGRGVCGVRAGRSLGVVDADDLGNDVPVLVEGHGADRRLDVLDLRHRGSDLLTVGLVAAV